MVGDSMCVPFCPHARPSCVWGVGGGGDLWVQQWFKVAKGQEAEVRAHWSGGVVAGWMGCGGAGESCRDSAGRLREGRIGHLQRLAAGN